MKRLGWMVLGALVAVGAYALFESDLSTPRAKVTVVQGKPAIITSTATIADAGFLRDGRTQNSPQPRVLSASLQRKAQVGYWSAGVLLILLALPLGAILLAVVLLGMALHGWRKRRRGGESEAEDVGLIQELHRGISRLEERVESLETLLLDRARDAAGTREAAGLKGIR